jgi:hypothetical protein
MPQEVQNVKSMSRSTIVARHKAEFASLLANQAADRAALLARHAAEREQFDTAKASIPDKRKRAPILQMDWRSTGPEIFHSWEALATRLGIAPQSLRVGLSGGRKMHRTMVDDNGNPDAVTITRLA